MNGLPLIRLAGEPREQGRAFGRATANLVAHNLAVYFKRFLEETYLDRAEVLGRVGRYWPVVEAEAPAFAGEFPSAAGDPPSEPIASQRTGGEVPTGTNEPRANSAT